MCGETIRIPVVVGYTDGAIQYNSFDMRFSYDPSILELTSTTLPGMSVTAKNGVVRILRYGGDLTLGETAFALTFKAIQAGETTIQAVSAKVGIRQTAQEKDAADAAIVNDVTVKIKAGRDDGKDTADGSNPRTGDGFAVGIWYTSALTSLSVLLLLVRNRKSCNYGSCCIFRRWR